MKKFKLVDINSPAFRKQVVNIINQVEDIMVSQNVRFYKLADGWIRDMELKIEWGPSSTSSMKFKAAQEYVEKHNGRLPTLKELHSLVDYDKREPAIDKSIFSDTKNDYYWTSKMTSWRSDAAWCVSFGFGFVYYNFEIGGNYVRAVRASQTN